MSKNVVMVGAGVANVNAATKLIDNGFKGKITIIDMGKNPYDRKYSEVMEGFLGAGGWSDGKLTYHTSIGGQLSKYCGEEKAMELFDQVIDNFKRFHPNPSEVQCSNPVAEPDFIKPHFGLRLFPVWHVGTDYLHEIGKNWHDYLVEKGVEFIWETRVTDIDFDKNIVMYDGGWEDYDELIFGVGNSADRWLDLYFIRFQPSELMKILVPLMLAAFYADKPLPPKISYIFVAILIVLVPVLMIMRQPDLGTALLIGMSGAIAILLAGMSFKFFLGGVISAASFIPILWLNMHQYQKQRVLTFFNPESDPLGSGYHLMQSKIALGSGGFFGKGFFNGTQSKLGFVPEHSTDFIFTAFGEEFGYLGVIILMSLYLFIALRGLSISIKATDNFGRILTGTLSLTIFLYVLVNVGMVIGFLPVVGAPLPFMSYGGTSMVTLFATLGIIMSIKSHQRILRK